jgi:hypothetical protein
MFCEATDDMERVKDGVVVLDAQEAFSLTENVPTRTGL